MAWPSTNDLTAFLKAMSETTGLNVPTVTASSAIAKAPEVAFLGRCFKILLDKSNEKDAKIRTLEETVEDLSTRLTALENKPTQPAWSGLFNSSTATVDPETKKQETKLLSAVSLESQEQQKRIRNLVVFGLPESNQTEAKDRIEHDLKLAKEVFTKLKANPSSVVRVHRLKKPSTDTSRPGPLVVEVKEPKSVSVESEDTVVVTDDRMVVLRNSKDLQKLEDYKNVYVRPDMTMAQRERHKELVAERNSKNSGLSKVNGRFVGAFYHGIRDGKVVKITIRNSAQNQTA